MPATDVVARRLKRDWRLDDPTITAHRGGMNSRTWLVTDGHRRWVAKSVGPAAAGNFRRGLAVTERVEASGIPAGAPVRTRAGRTTVDPRTGVCGLIDWDRALVGPLMYDVASAVMYAGGPDRAGDLIDAYVAAGALERSEVERTLGTMLAVRWAVQADSFAKRITTNDLTGIDGPAENDVGLRDAHEALADLGA